jgi:hypothetical protein
MLDEKYYRRGSKSGLVLVKDFATTLHDTVSPRFASLTYPPMTPSMVQYSRSLRCMRRVATQASVSSY